ncbi:hypothetical protein BCR34DRAFT_498029 [Clohesyomyces aquaticus]|uniref:Uncharacterized protein n=1 Tax=Clohesyomyces aquaticus TaxID=1231657 RepID=A0A1Y1YDK8_9PLEO|nr:hypothetical protein BCR34DRAFT_498029 [Clohesyomyces aquaticus]
MGGNAFKFAGLSFPRISAALYCEVRNFATTILQQHFTHVIVPSELPSKTDFGDVDFLVSGPIDPSIAVSITPTRHPTTWNLWPVVDAIKSPAGFHTPHGRKGGKNPDIMYFAILPPDREDPNFWIQIDVKVCPDVKRFEWDVFQLRYASAAKFVGSMIKPLGLTIDNEGLYLRVQEMEEVNWEGSMVFLGDKPEDVLAVAGLDDRMVKGRFARNEELFEYLTSYWLFNPQHFAERLKDLRYVEHIEKRAPWWLSFIYEWIPARFPGYRFPSGPSGDDSQNQDLDQWYAIKRSEVREKVFGMFPAHVRSGYEEKKRVHLQGVEEARLRELIKAAIPKGDEDWKDTYSLIPPILYKPAVDSLDAIPMKGDGNGSASTIKIDTSGTVNFVGMWKKRFEKEDAKSAGTRRIERRLARLTPALIVDLEG